MSLFASAFSFILAQTSSVPELKVVPDSVRRAAFEEKLSKLSQMSVEDIIQMVTHSVVEIALKIIVALVIYFIGRWLIRAVRRFLNRIFEKRDVDISLRSFLQSFVQISLTLFLIIIIVGILGIDTTSFVALFASAGLAVGMALSGTLQNFAGGVMILILKPYRVGDYIEAQGQNGKVKEIRLFNTVLNTVDNKTIIIPNGGISTGIINNYSKEEQRRVDWLFGIAYGDDYDKAKAILADLLDKDPRVLKEPACFIALHSLGDSSVNIVVRAWTASPDYWDVYFDMNEKVYKTFAENNINIPFPQMDVHLTQETPQS